MEVDDDDAPLVRAQGSQREQRIGVGAALAAAAPLQMLPPRRVVDTSFDGSGRPTPGRCLPYALLLQLQNQGSKAAARVPTGADVAAIDQLRNTVLDFAVANEGTRWRDEDEYRSLGHVIAAVIENRGWAPQGCRRGRRRR